MAEEKKEGGGETAGQAALSVLGVLALLVILWFANGGYQRADLRGIFLAPPAPVGPGNAYGPNIGEQNPYIPGIDAPRE
jgi:hypothetical protein